MSDRRRRNFLKAAAAAAVFGTMQWPSRVAADESKPMKIGMIGSGNVGSALGRAWARAGHPVMFSSRHLEDDQRLAADIGANARAGTPRESAEFGEVLVFAVPYGALPELGQALRESIQGKVVIDACNPFPRRDGEIAERARETGAG